MAFNTDLGQEEEERVVHPGEGSSCDGKARGSCRRLGSGQRRSHSKDHRLLAGSLVLPPVLLATRDEERRGL